VEHSRPTGGAPACPLTRRSGKYLGEEPAMDLSFTPEEEAFRADVQRFLRDKLPQRLSEKVHGGRRLTRDDMAEWHAILNTQGWLANHWPKEYGGPGWNAVQKFIF